MSSNLESLGNAIKAAQNRNNSLVRTTFNNTPTREIKEADEMINDLNLSLRNSSAAFRQLNNDRTDIVFEVIDDLEVNLSEDEKANGKSNLKELADAIDEIDTGVVKNLTDWKNSSNELLDNAKFRFGTTAQFLANFNPNYGADAVELSAIDSVIGSIHKDIDDITGDLV